MLRIAHIGLTDVEADDVYRRYQGAFSLVVFGRSVTLALQHMRTQIGHAVFDEWYLPQQDAMATDELVDFFGKLRNRMLKEGGPDLVYRGVYSTTTDDDGNQIGQQQSETWLDLSDIDRPTRHRGQELSSEQTRLPNLGRLYLAYLAEVVDKAEARFVLGDQKSLDPE